MKNAAVTNKMSEAHQYTLCLLALTLCKTCNDIIGPATTECPELKTITDNIATHTAQCISALPHRTLSAGAKRDLDKSFNIIAPRIEYREDTPASERLHIWGANVWAALTLVMDAKNLARAFTNKECWVLLEENMTALAEAIAEMCEGCDEVGTKLYMELV